MSSTLLNHLNFLIIEDENENKGNFQTINSLVTRSGCDSVHSYTVTSEYQTWSLERSTRWFIQQYDKKDIHFIVSNNTRFPFYKVAAFDYLIPIVTAQWVQTCIERNHLLRTLNFSPDLRHVLKDTTIYIVRNPSMSHADYRFYTEIITALGGMYTDSLSNKITHLVATSCHNPLVHKFCSMVKNVDNIKIIYPTWLIHCFKTIQYIPEQLHKIDISNDTGIVPTQNNINADEKIEDLWEEIQNLNPIEPIYKYLTGHKFVIDLELSLSQKLYDFLVELIKSYGGSFFPYINNQDLIDDNNQIDCFIGESTTTKGYEKCRNGSTRIKTGNLIWFFNMWTFESFVAPNVKMIWNPFKPKIFKSMDLILSHTNYFGQERIYIQKLTEILGGTITSSLSSKNTHLISRSPHGRKFANATTKKPNCKVVNHLWLEECYNKGQILDTDIPEFKDFTLTQKGLSYLLNQIGGIDYSRINALFDTEMNKLTQGSNSSGEETDIGFSTANENETTVPDMDKSMGNSTIMTSFPALDAITKPSPGVEKVQLVDNEVTPLRLDYTMPVKPSDEKREVEGNNQEDTKERVRGTISDDTKQNVLKEGKQEITDDTKKETTDEAKEYEELFGVLTKSHQSTIATKKISMTTNDTLNTPVASRQSSTRIKSVAPSASKQNDANDNTTNQTNDKSNEPITPPPTDPSVVEFSNMTRKRAARDKAEKRLHEDIESLNEFEKNKRKKRIGNLLPSEIERLEHNKKLKHEAKETVLCLKGVRLDISDEEFLKELKHSYNIKGFITGCLEQLREIDIEILSLLGIQITEEYSVHLNCIVTPKRLRTMKFFNALSFHPLEYILLPTFITEILTYVKEGEDPTKYVKTEDYKMMEMDADVIMKTKLNNKLFERAFISNVNITSDVPGGVDTVSKILLNHGIKDIQKLGNNKNKLLPNNHPHKRITLNNGKLIHPPRCIIIGGSKNSLRKWKKEWNEVNAGGSTDGLLIVNWDWCVDSIFKLDVDYNSKKDVLYSSL